MNAVKERFSDSYINSVIIEHPNLTLDEIQSYLERTTTGTVHAVLGGRFIEGIEFSDANGSSLLKQAVIVGVPFNPPTEEQKQVENYYTNVFNWDQWDCMRAFMYTPVYQKVRQAMGRTVRNLTDRANIVFMDGRYANSKMLRRAMKF
jgi:Rad3-related DNA helicase